MTTTDTTTYASTPASDLSPGYYSSEIETYLRDDQGRLWCVQSPDLVGRAPGYPQVEALPARPHVASGPADLDVLCCEHCGRPLSDDEAGQAREISGEMWCSDCGGALRAAVEAQTDEAHGK